MEPELLFDGMSFRVFRSGEPDCVTVEFTDTITAFGGIKRAEISGKGEINASIASMVAEYIGKNGRDYRSEEAENPVPALQDRKADNTEIGRIR